MGSGLLDTLECVSCLGFAGVSSKLIPKSSTRQQSEDTVKKRLIFNNLQWTRVNRKNNCKMHIAASSCFCGSGSWSRLLSCVLCRHRNSSPKEGQHQQPQSFNGSHSRRSVSVASHHFPIRPMNKSTLELADVLWHNSTQYTTSTCAGLISDTETKQLALDEL